MSLTRNAALATAAPTKKELILQAAARCFVEEGFHGSSMSRIAKAAGVSVGHIYHYFESKNDIIAAIVREEEVKAAEKLAYFRSLPIEELTDTLVSKIDDAVCHNSDVFHSVLMLEILAEAARNPDIATIVQELDTTMREGFLEILEQRLGLDNGKARVEALFTIFGGLAIRSLRNPSIDRAALIPVLENTIRQIISKG